MVRAKVDIYSQVRFVHSFPLINAAIRQDSTNTNGFRWMASCALSS